MALNMGAILPFVALSLKGENKTVAISGYRSVTELFPVQRVSDLPWTEVQAEQHADAFQLPGRRRDC